MAENRCNVAVDVGIYVLLYPLDPVYVTIFNLGFTLFV